MPTATTADAAFRADRVQARLRELGELTGDSIDRSGWSPAETAAHELVSRWMTEAHLRVGADPAGNLHGTRRGTSSDSQVWIGSHLDTVPHGGLYDGALGVLIGIETIDIVGERPLGAAVVAWRDEEGTRFGLGCNGARALVGGLRADQLALTDVDGVSLAEAIASVGASVGDGWAVPPPVAYLEPHMEPGVIVAEAGVTAAVVTGSVARVRLDVQIVGKAGHASTPLDRRSDAGVVAAQLVLCARDLARREPAAVATVGSLRLTPGARNVVPERAELYLDMRAPGDAALTRMLDSFQSTATDVAQAEGCSVATAIRQREPAVSFDSALLNTLRAHMDPDAPELVSWGGHDALIVAQAGVPAAMLYLASANEGAAHSPRERTETPVIADAIERLSSVLTELTEEDHAR